jgi:type I restriction enzyme, S subunit
MTATLRTIREIAVGVYDGPHATPELHDEGAAVFLGIPNLLPDGRIDVSAARWVSERDLPKWNRRVTPQSKDIVFTYEATLNRYAIIPDDFPCCLGRRTALIRTDPSQVDHRFLFYYFFSPRWRAQIDEKTLTGATVDRIPLTTFPDFQVLLPELAEQRQIAEVLSAYDDLVTTNQRRSELLEDAVLGLYREWFVQLRFPGHDLVPKEGGVPKGWRKAPIGDLFAYFIGGGWGQELAESESSEPAYVIRGTDIPRIREGGKLVVPLRFHPVKNLASRRLQAGDLVFEVSGGGRDQGVGRLLLVTTDLLDQFDQPVMCASFCKLIRPHVGLSEFLTCTLQHLRRTDGLRRFENQSASNIVNFAFTDFCAKQSVIVPNEEVLALFREAVSLLWKQNAVIAKQQGQLSRARDMLLPKLMSGKLDVGSIRLPEEATT